MGAFARGSVVLVDFPFTNLTGSRVRPALVLADLPHDDYILCMITSSQYSSPYAIELKKADFSRGELPNTKSYIRPERLFTVEEKKLKRSVGELTLSKEGEVKQKLHTILCS